MPNVVSVAIIPLTLILRSPKTGMDKFLSRRPNLRARNLTFTPDRARKKLALNTKVHVLGTTRSVAFCSLLPKCHLQFIFNAFPSKTYAMRLLYPECCFNVKNKMQLKEQFS